MHVGFAPFPAQTDYMGVLFLHVRVWRGRFDKEVKLLNRLRLFTPWVHADPYWEPRWQVPWGCNFSSARV